MRAQCIAVPFQRAEEVRRVLLQEGLLALNLAITRDEERVYLPVTGITQSTIFGYDIHERDFAELEKERSSYKEVVDILDDLRPLLPTSFDVVGRIAIVKMPDELLEYKTRIANAIMDVNKSIETVALDNGVEGEERVRKLDVVAGETDTETVHKEYGVELELDPRKVYFSPRLATEHWRVAQNVGKGEVVIDMFCGVGPFAILIAKHGKPKNIFAMDINESAIHYLKKNIQRNRASNITSLLGDARQIVPGLEEADTIIMNLPHSSFEFLSTALESIKDRGVIYYYALLSEEEKDAHLKSIIELGERMDLSLTKLGERSVHTYSPSSSVYCFDLQAGR